MSDKLCKKWVATPHGQAVRVSNTVIGECAKGWEWMVGKIIFPSGFMGG